MPDLLVERQGANAALILSAGTEDTLDIRRELRYDTYDLMAVYPKALVAHEQRFALSARLGPDGPEWRPLDEQELTRVIDSIRASGAQAVGICLLHSPANQAHEDAVANALAAALPDLPVCSSADIAREIGEYERMSTVATFSAMRAGCVKPKGQSVTPKPRRICSVTWLSAPSSTSGAGQCERPSRKWCSTAHTVLKPRRSPSLICSSASR